MAYSIAPKSKAKVARAESCPRCADPYLRYTVSRVVDVHMPPAARRWVARLGLAVMIAIAIGYVPGAVLRRDPRTAKLDQQLGTLAAEAAELEAANRTLLREIDALKTDVGAIEDRARADLGLVYPDEIVIRMDPARGTTP